MKRVVKLRDVIILRWNSIIISLTSIVYGSWLLIHPDILKDYTMYEVINQMFNSHFICFAFIFCGMLKLLGILINSKALKKVSIFALSFLWMMFGVSFALATISNTVWIFAFSIALLSFGVAMKER